jgi:hypothetical protein
MCIFVCKLHLHFPDSKHLRGFVCHEIFGNFLRHSEIFGLHPPTIHATYGPAVVCVNIFCKRVARLRIIYYMKLQWRKHRNLQINRLKQIETNFIRICKRLMHFYTFCWAAYGYTASNLAFTHKKQNYIKVHKKEIKYMHYKNLTMKT